jgi:hypothetical protein
MAKGSSNRDEIREATAEVVSVILAEAGKAGLNFTPFQLELLRKGDDAFSAE